MTLLDTPRTHLTDRRTRRRRAAAVGLAAAGVLALSGCMKTQYDITLNEDDTASMSVILAISDEFAEAMDTDPQEMWDDAEMDSDAPEGADAEPYAEDGYTGTRYTLESAPLADVSTEDLTITREGDEYVVTGEVDLTDEEGVDSGETDDPMTQLFLDSFVMQYSVTFPGAVSDHNGELSGTTVTWTPAYGEVTEFSARGSAVAGGAVAEPSEEATDEATDEPTEEATDEATDEATEEATDEATPELISAEDTATSGSGFPWWILIVAVVVLGAAITGIVLLARRSKGAGPTTSLAPAGVAAGGAWQGDQQGQYPGQAPQGYAPPPQQGYAPPPQGYQAPPPGYQPPPPGYQAPPQGYQAPPETPQGYAAPPAGGPVPPPPAQGSVPPPADQPTQVLPTDPQQGATPPPPADQPTEVIQTDQPGPEQPDDPQRPA